MALQTAAAEAAATLEVKAASRLAEARRMADAAEGLCVAASDKNLALQNALAAAAAEKDAELKGVKIEHVAALEAAAADKARALDQHASALEAAVADVVLAEMRAREAVDVVAAQAALEMGEAAASAEARLEAVVVAAATDKQAVEELRSAAAAACSKVAGLEATLASTAGALATKTAELSEVHRTHAVVLATFTQERDAALLRAHTEARAEAEAEAGRRDADSRSTVNKLNALASAALEAERHTLRARYTEEADVAALRFGSALEAAEAKSLIAAGTEQRLSSALLEAEALRNASEAASALLRHDLNLAEGELSVARVAHTAAAAERGAALEECASTVARHAAIAEERDELAARYLDASSRLASTLDAMLRAQVGRTTAEAAASEAAIGLAELEVALADAEEAIYI